MIKQTLQDTEDVTITSLYCTLEGWKRLGSSLINRYYLVTLDTAKRYYKMGVTHETFLQQTTLHLLAVQGARKIIEWCNLIFKSSQTP